MPTDSFLPVAFAFWLSHIARYAPSPARQNPLDMNDPKFTFIFKQPLSYPIGPKGLISPIIPIHLAQKMESDINFSLTVHSYRINLQLRRFLNMKAILADIQSLNLE